MKKSFFLLAAALAAIFSFFACTDDKDGDEPVEGPGPSSSSDGAIPVQFACTNVDEENLFAGGICIEYSDFSPADLAKHRADCIEEDEDGDAGTIIDKCPASSVFNCPYPEDGIGIYFYGLPGTFIQAILGGKCPEDPSAFDDGDDDDDDDDEPIACTDPSYGEGAPLPYEGQTYKTVKIGCQTWMAENLNYETEEGSECYKDDPENCEIYGRLYTWNTAMEVCPSGWHLPTLTEWKTLINAVGGKSVAGKHLKSTYGWRESYWNDEEGNGLDTYGFTALPSDGFFIISTSASWWSSDRDKDNSSDYAIGIYIEGDSDSARESSAPQDDYTRSVRCIQDP